MATCLINGFVEFDEERCELRSLIEPGCTSTLGATASRCLVALLRARGEVVTKRTLLYEAWEKYGSMATGNSANQAIAQIRCVFQAVGFDSDPIVTIPRIGYKFRDGVRLSSDPVAQDKIWVSRQGVVPASGAAIAADSCPDPESKGAGAVAQRKRGASRRVGAAVVGGIAALNLAAAVALAAKAHFLLPARAPCLAYVSMQGLTCTFGPSGGQAYRFAKKFNKLKKMPSQVGDKL